MHTNTPAGRLEPQVLSGCPSCVARRWPPLSVCLPELNWGCLKLDLTSIIFPGLKEAQCQRLAGAIPHPPSVCLTSTHHQSGLGEMEGGKERESITTEGRGIKQWTRERDRKERGKGKRKEGVREAGKGDRDEEEREGVEKLYQKSEGR